MKILSRFAASIYFLSHLIFFKIGQIIARKGRLFCLNFPLKNSGKEINLCDLCASAVRLVDICCRCLIGQLLQCLGDERLILEIKGGKKILNCLVPADQLNRAV